MSNEKKEKKRRINGLDITIILLVILVALGSAGRIVLDRVNSRGIEERTVSFTCTLPQDELDILAVGNTLTDASGNEMGSVTEIHDTVLLTETVGESKVKYYRVTGEMLVKGYEAKDGVFYTVNGEEMRINTTFSLGTGKNLTFCLNDIVKNGQ